MKASRILIVDADKALQDSLREVLESKGCRVRSADSAEAALPVLLDWNPEVAIVEIDLPDRSGLQLLREIKRHTGDTEVLITTRLASAASAREAIQNGAHDYLEKPFYDSESVCTSVNRALEKRNLALKHRDLIEQREQRNRELLSTLAEIEKESIADDNGSCSELLEFFIEMIVNEVGVERASLMLLNEESGELRIAASRGIHEIDTDRVRVRPGEGVCGFVADTGEPVMMTCTPEENGDGGNRHSGVPDPARSEAIAMIVPIRSGGKVMGVINVTHRQSGKEFDTQDLDHLDRLAGQLAVIIEEARRSEKIKKTYESLRATRNQLVFADRVNMLGQIAAGVAHDFNNSLSVILVRAQFALMKLESGSMDRNEFAGNLEKIIMSSLQGAENIKRIQDYTRRTRETRHGAVNMKSVIRDAVEIARPKWEEEPRARGKSIQVHFELQNVPAVSGNLYELTQVVGNLIFNAVEAMPEGGDLTIRTGSVDKWVEFQVTDTGIGMDEETQANLFKPFFTTKKSGQGLGTSILFGIVTRHKGRIEVVSRVGEGTTFAVKLPSFVPDPRPAPSPTADLDEKEKPIRILFADDDELVRQTFEEILKSRGHQVVTVKNGREALDMFQKREFDLVLTDLSMPEISGFELARETKKLNPAVPVILLTGWMLEKNDRKIQESGIDDVLIKPCQIEELLHAVRKVLPISEPVS